jgi:hypothetical protein
VSNVRVYLNPDITNWRHRDPSMALRQGVDYQLDAVNGVITLDEPLRPGETVVAEYDHHAAGKVRSLVSIVLGLAAQELGRRLPMQSEAKSLQWEYWGKAANAQLMAIVGGKDRKAGGVTEFDGLDLVRETRGTGRGVRLFRGRGW